MNQDEAKKRFTEYTEKLIDACRDTPNVIGLVLVGSVAETQRADQWSDHDFFVITESGAQEKLRQDLTWLPTPEEISFSFRETAHGLKVVYKNGAVLEFAIFDTEELRACAVNHNKLAFGTKEVKEALAIASERTAQYESGDSLSDFRHFLSLILIGVGRARRGEILTAGQGIRSYAFTLLMKIFARELAYDSRLDRLDPFRRFEQVHPELGNELALALQNSPESVARQLLDIADRHLATIWINYPTSEVKVIRDVLTWST